MTKINMMNNMYIEEIDDKKLNSKNAIRAISFKKKQRVGKMRLARNQLGKIIFGSTKNEG